MQIHHVQIRDVQIRDMYVDPLENIGKWKNCVGKVGVRKVFIKWRKVWKNMERKNCVGKCGVGKVWYGKSLGWEKSSVGKVQ